MSYRMQWPLHTREDMEALRAEWEKPSGFIPLQILPDPAKRFTSGLFTGIFLGSAGATLLIGLLTGF